MCFSENFDHCNVDATLKKNQTVVKTWQKQTHSYGN